MSKIMSDRVLTRLALRSPVRSRILRSIYYRVTSTRRILPAGGYTVVKAAGRSWKGWNFRGVLLRYCANTDLALLVPSTSVWI